MRKTVTIGIITLFLGLSFAYGQKKDNISAEETINYINGKLTGIAKVKNEKGMLIVEFSEHGKVNRVDKVPIESLNPDDVEYLPGEKTVVVRCLAKDCIDRKIEIPKTKGQFSRISFAGEFDAKTQKGLVKAFEHLIMLFRDSTYKNATPFEQ